MAVASVIAVFAIRAGGGANATEKRVIRLSVPSYGVAARPEQLAIVPMGRFIIYRTEAAGAPSQLNVRWIDSFETSVVGNTADRCEGWGPFVSPDGKHVAAVVAANDACILEFRDKVDLEFEPTAAPPAAARALVPFAGVAVAPDGTK